MAIAPHLRGSEMGNRRWCRLRTVPTLALFLLLSVSMALAQSTSPDPELASGLMGPQGDFLHARKLYDQGMYDFATTEFEQFLKEYPNHDLAGDAALLLANALRKQGEIASARNAYQRASVYLSDSTRAVEALHNAAEMDLLLGDTARAVDRYLAVQVLYPDRETYPRTLLRAGELLVNARRWPEAERTLNTLLREFPGTEWEQQGRLLLARAYAGQGDLIPALQEARGVAQATGSDSLRARAGLYVGRWELLQHNPVAAAEIWNAVLDGMGNTAYIADVALELARLNRRMGRCPRAQELYDRASRAEPDSTRIAEFQHELAGVMFETGRFDVAERLYLAADSTRTVLQRAWTADRQGNLEVAKDLYRRAFAQHSSDQRANQTDPGDRAELHAAFNVAQLGYRLDEPDLSGFHDALRNADDPATYQAVRLRAVETIRSQNPDIALRFLENTQPADQTGTPFDDDLLLQHAELLALTGDLDEAAENYRTYAERFRASEQAADARSRADYLDRFQQMESDALAELATALDRFGQAPGNANARLELASIYLHGLKQPASARTLLQPMLSDSSLADTLRNRARDTYAAALWMEWQQVSHGLSGDELPLSETLRTRADTTLRLMTALYPDTTVLLAQPERSWRVKRLTELRLTNAATRTDVQRRIWADFLRKHPDSGHANDVRLRLATAIRTRLTGDVDATNDSLYRALLRPMLDHPQWTPERLNATLELERYSRSIDSTTAADSLARLLLNAPPSPERTAIAWQWIEQAPRSEEAKQAANWLASEASYLPSVMDRAPLLGDALLGLPDVHATPDSIVAAETAEALNHLLHWSLAARPGEPEFVDESLLTGDRRLLRGLVAEANGRTLDAILDYSYYLNTSGEQADYRTLTALRLARAYDRADQWEQALPYYELALQEGPQDDALQPMRRRLARYAFRAQQYEQASEWAKAASQKENDPDSAFVLDELAIVSLYRAGRLEKAQPERKAFQGWYKDHPDRDKALARFELEIGRYLSSVERYGDAMKAYKEVLDNYGETMYEPYARYEIARDYMEQGEAEKAYEMLIELSNEHPEHPVMGQVYWLLGNYYASTGSYFEAFNKYEAVLADSAYIESWPYVLGNQVRAFKEAGFYEGAMRAARRYLQMYPDGDEAFDHRMNLALAYHETGHYDLAISQFRRAMVLAGNEDYAACQFYIAEALERSGQLKEAVSEYMRVVNLNRETKLKWGVTALYNAGKVLERMNEPERAKKLYREIVAREGMGSPFGRRADEQVKRLEMFEEDQARGASR